MGQYELKLFYNPRKIGMRLLTGVYVDNGLPCPSEDELRKPFHVDTARGIEVAIANFSPLPKDKAIKLASSFLDLPDTHIEISHVG